MATVNADGSSQFPADIQPRVDLVWRLATIRRFVYIHQWTGWTRATALSHDDSNINFVLVIRLLDPSSCWPIIVLAGWKILIRPKVVVVWLTECYYYMHAVIFMRATPHRYAVLATAHWHGMSDAFHKRRYLSDAISVAELTGRREGEVVPGHSRQRGAQNSFI